VLRRILGLKKVGGLRRLQNDELHNCMLHYIIF